MKQPLQVGDRVRVYGVVDHAVLNGSTGRISEVCLSGWVRVNLAECKRSVLAHPKQVRRLKKRERRKVWVWGQTLNDPVGFRLITDISKTLPTELAGWVEFVEARK